jgi:uncharacterized protein YifE (UPF0438 family)
MAKVKTSKKPKAKPKPKAIQPVTKEQKHFLKVDREEVEPSTVCERA